MRVGDRSGSSHANVRDSDARLRWPPSAMDYKLDALEAGPDASVRKRERERGRSRQRGFAPDARKVFEDEWERQLTDLVLLLALEEGL